MHTQKKPAKYISHASRYTKKTKHSRSKHRRQQFCVKCALCTSVFTLTLLVDSQWPVLTRHSQQTTAPCSSPQKQTAASNQLPPASAEASASKSSTESDRTAPDKNTVSDRPQQPDSKKNSTASKKQSDTADPIPFSEKDAAKESTITNTDEQTFYSKDHETESEIDYSYAEHQTPSSANPDSTIQAVPEQLPSGLLIDTKISNDETTHLSNLSSDWNLILVNPWNKLPDDYEVALTPLPNGHSIDSRCYDALTDMINDCREAGLEPLICSSYRSQEKQESLFQERTEELLAQGYSKKDAKAKAATSVARPGTSEHQLGLAVDLVDKSHQTLDAAQEYTPVQQWLMENSWKYGFILRYPNDKSSLTGIIYEPWHYRYVGPEAAQEIYERGICLEEYLEELS